MDNIISVKNLCKNYNSNNDSVIALDNVSFDVKKGEIFGIIGLSGAGKSTLVRCLNLLEKPNSGEIIIDNQDMLNLNDLQLQEKRKRISMVFQNFNLLSQSTALSNVMFPCEIAKKNKSESKEIAKKYLEVVGLKDKENSYPSQLSGGQKQRVAIARALASDPEIIICDEATSALDPKTSKDILSLLKQINKDYKITIVIITHQMSVIQEICDRCLVLENGKIAELDTVQELFSNPKSKASKNLIFSNNNTVSQMKGGKVIRVAFKSSSSLEPVIGNLILEFKTPVNILESQITTVNGLSNGEMYLQLPKDEIVADKMIKYLNSKEFISVSEV